MTALRRMCVRAALRLAMSCVVVALAQPALAANREEALTIVGSDTLSTLLLRWIDAFRAGHAAVAIQLQTPGSASAPIALLEGAADLGAMSRSMSESERASFRSRFGYEPTGIVVAHDAIVVFVHPDNPLDRITRRQLDAIYSSTRRCGAAAAITRWSELGAPADGKVADILPIGRNDASGTYAFFRDNALCGGEYRADVVAWPGHGATVAAVAANPEAIGYAGIGYVNGLVKPLAFAPEEGARAVAPVMRNVMNGDYALSRPLYLYVNRPPDRAPAPLSEAFVAFALSDAGQAMVGQEGFLEATGEERSMQARSIHATIPPS